MVVTGLSLITAISVIIFILVKWRLTHWKRRGIPSFPTRFIFGNAKQVICQQEPFTDFFIRYYNQIKKDHHRHGGIYLALLPTYMPIDPKIIESILQKDFGSFLNRAMYFNEVDDPLSAHLFAVEGSHWRTLRMKLSPTFTSGQMKKMFDTAAKCGYKLIEIMDKTIGKPVEIKGVVARYAMDTIGNCAFGVDCNSLQKPNNNFTKNFDNFFRRSLWESVIFFFVSVAPNWGRRCGVTITNSVLAKFFLETMRAIVEHRERNNIHRNDFVHLLLQLKNRGGLVDDGKILGQRVSTNTLTFEEIAAQAFVFFAGGYENASTTIGFCLLELALNQDIQEKLREEVNSILEKHHGILCYDAIKEMIYMDMVVNETLRKYPPVPFLRRCSTKKYQIPGTKIVLDKDTTVAIPIIGLHYDPEYYPHPEKFVPERFQDQNKESRTPYTFLPFGMGPRNCIGQRFGLMQIKIGLTLLLKNYKFVLNSKTVLPLKYSTDALVLIAKDGLWLDYNRIEQQ